MQIFQIKAGNTHAGFNADLTEDGQVVDTIASYTLGWDSFQANACSQIHITPSVKVVDKAGKTEEFPDDSVDGMDDIDDDIDDASECSFDEKIERK